MLKRSKFYLESILNYCEDIKSIQEQFGNSYDNYIHNKGYQYAISFCMEQIGELAKKLRDLGFDKIYPQIPWNEIAGLRNRIAHGYDSIDLEMVFDISFSDIPELYENCKIILDNILTESSE